MVTSHTLIKDILLAVAIIGIFCCFALVAHAFQLAIEIEYQEAMLTAAVSEPGNDSPERFREEHKSTEGIEIAPIPKEVGEEGAETTDESLIEERAPVKEIAPVADESKPVVKEVAIKTPTAPVNDDSFAAEVVSLIEQETNSFRRSNDLTALMREPVLAQNAKNYSQTMLRGDFLSHTNEAGCDLTCRFKTDGYVASSWGENLAMIKFDDKLSAEKVADYFMTGWKKSAGHRDNLLSSEFTHQGVGVAYSNNAVYVSVQFAKLGD